MKFIEFSGQLVNLDFAVTIYKTEYSQHFSLDSYGKFNILIFTAAEDDTYFSETFDSEEERDQRYEKIKKSIM